MPRRAAKVTQADISRAIRAAKESGAGKVFIAADGRIEIVVEPEAPRIQPDAPEGEKEKPEEKPEWEMSDPPNRRDQFSHRKGTERG